jgi:N-acyl-D-amino-acid deacylase
METNEFLEHKVKKTAILGILISLLLASCQPTDSVPTTGEYKFGMGHFDRTMIQLMEKWEIPGGALAVAQDGQLLLARGYGYADVENGELVQPDSLFRIASISKPITAAAVLKLVEEGKLDLDMPAFQLMDDFQHLEGVEAEPRLAQITIRHLLEHSGGWDRNISFDPMFRAVEIAREMGTPQPADCPTIIRYMLGQPLDFDPSSHYAYSNFGYCVLGRVIEQVSGQPYEAYVKNNILAPIGIENMHLGRTLLADQLQGEVNYYADETTITWSVFPGVWNTVPWPYGGFHLEAMDAHGGWIASATDLARFAYALDAENPRAILDVDSLAVMFTRPDIPLWEGTDSYYALGWHVRPAGKSANLWHAGSLPGTTAMVYRSSSGLVWVALFNTRPTAAEDEFFVDLITVMGQAAIMDEVYWVCGGLLVLLLGMGTLLVVRAQKRRELANKKE